MDEILTACTADDVQRCLFSATMLPAVEELADTVLRSAVRVVVGEKNAASEIIEQSLVFCGREDGKLLELRKMVREGIKPPVLIFVQSKERAMQVKRPPPARRASPVMPREPPRGPAARTAARPAASAASSRPRRFRRRRSSSTS